jgi:nucleoside 2-deoxyribosyltransferase
MSFMSVIKRVPVIYLAGGMKTNWQSLIKEHCKGAIFIDPRESGQPAEAEYTAWDLAAVERCDAIVGLMEATNPGGAGLAVEFGWGARAGKHLILVEQAGYPQERYFGMVRAMASAAVKVTTFEDAVEQAIRLTNSYILDRKSYTDQ